MSSQESETESDDELSADSGDELIGTEVLQDNDSDTIKHSQDGNSEEREN